MPVKRPKSTHLDKTRKQRTKLRAEKVKKIAVISFSFLLSTLFLFGFILYKKVSQNFVSAESYNSYSLSNDHFPTFSYIVVDSFSSDPIVVDKMEFVILDKESKKALIYTIPLNYIIDVPGRYSTEEFSKIFALGGLNAPDKLMGGLLLTNKTIFDLFGFKVDNYILVDRSLKDDFDKFVHGGALFPLLDFSNLPDVKSSFRTNMSLPEFYNTYLFLKSLPADRSIRETLTFSYMQNPALLDNVIQDLTISSPISLEKKNIAVLNGTDISGIAQLGSRVVRNMGGRVVAVGNSVSKYDESMLVVDNKNSETVRFLSHVFGVTKVLGKEEAFDVEENEIDRADITLILGFDLAETM